MGLMRQVRTDAKTFTKISFDTPFIDSEDFSAMVDGTTVEISDVVHKAFIGFCEKFFCIICVFSKTTGEIYQSKFNMKYFEL
uniref:Uncharacterized protein n=1 Tax=Romanomermis culicivorax TaxID=13658 RepID=A0A915JC29_ROMCU